MKPQQSAPKKKLIRSLPVLIVAAVLTVVSTAIVALIIGFQEEAPVKRKMVQQISLIQPPPPPPKIEQPPPPPQEEEVKLDEQEPDPEPVPDTAADQPPAGELLGLDADGGAGGDAFGLIGKKGGRSLLSGGGNPFAWYAGILQQDILERLYSEDRVRKKKYSVRVKLWITPEGAVKKFELVDSSGNREVDESLRIALADIDRVRELPPQEMPQPIRVRISSRL